MHLLDQAISHEAILFFLIGSSSKSFANALDSQRSPGFQLSRWIYSYIYCPAETLSYPRTPKNIFPSIFNSEMGRKCLIPSAFIALGIQIPSSSLHSCGTMLCCHTLWRRVISILRIHKDFLYSLFGIPFILGALSAHALWTDSCTTLSLMLLLLNATFRC